jgi:hypothetical protein
VDWKNPVKLSLIVKDAVLFAVGLEDATPYRCRFSINVTFATCFYLISSSSGGYFEVILHRVAFCISLF